MVSILASFDNLIIVEMLLEAMNCLLWTIIPTGVDPLLAFRILPRSVDLGDYRLGNVVGI
jgi:hypothetical protein